MRHFFFCIFLAIFFGFQSSAQTLARQRCASFGRGMNISNWLEATWQSNYPTPDGYSKNDLQLMKDAGIKSLRLPVNFASITDTAAPFFIDTAHVLFQRIDSVIKWADELNMNLIIDNHHGWNLTNENWRHHKDRFAQLWGMLAKKYSYLNPDNYFFELLNEPPIAFNDLDSLNLLFNTAIDSIRKYTSEHSVIVSPPLGSWGMAFDLYQPLADTNLIYTWHCYDPINFTHQGLTWNEPFYPSGNEFPTQGDPFYEQFLYQGTTRIINWIATYNQSLFLGEFGVSQHAPAESRCRWIEFLMQKTDSMHIPWFYWDWRWDFSIFNSHVVSEDSIIPCFKSALRLYGDSVLNTSEQHSGNFKIFPNPVNSGNFITIETAENIFDVRIIDAYGRELKTADYKTEKNNKSLFDVSFLDSGVYLLRIASRNKEGWFRLVKN